MAADRLPILHKNECETQIDTHVFSLAAAYSLTERLFIG